MKKAILISVRPEGVKKIIDREKIIEIRKTAPKCELPVDVYVYCTKGKHKRYMDTLYRCAGFLKCSPYDEQLNGKVVAKFTLESYLFIGFHKFPGLPLSYIHQDGFESFDAHERACICTKEIAEYLKLNRLGYSWHISNLEVFYKQKKLSDFGLKRAPQDWQYVEVKK